MPKRVGSHSLVSWVVVCIFMGLIAACMPSRQHGFGPVHSEVMTRTGFDAIWRTSAMDNDQYAAKVRAMLDANFTIDSAVRIALLNNRDLQATMENIGIALASLTSATLPSNPEIDADLRMPTSGSGKAIEFQATQDLIDLFTLPKRRSIANAELAGVRYETVGVVVDLVAEVRIAFYAIVASKGTLDLRRTVFDATAASYELARRLREAGNITELALMQERALHGESRLELAKAELGLQTTREILNGLLGLSGQDTKWEIDGDLPDIPKEAAITNTLESEAVANNVDLAAERWRMKAAAQRIGLARWTAWIPHVGAGVSAEREFSGEWNVGPALTLSIPLFNRKQGERAHSHAKLRQAQHRYAFIANKLRAVSRAARARLATARASALFIRDELMPIRKSVLAHTLLQYNAMNVSPFELLSAKRAQIATGANLIAAQREYWQARVEIDRLRAGRIGAMRAPTSGGESGLAVKGGHE